MTTADTKVAAGLRLLAFQEREAAWAKYIKIVNEIADANAANTDVPPKTIEEVYRLRTTLGRTENIEDDVAAVSVHRSLTVAAVTAQAQADTAALDEGPAAKELADSQADYGVKVREAGLRCGRAAARVNVVAMVRQAAVTAASELVKHVQHNTELLDRQTFLRLGGR